MLSKKAISKNLLRSNSPDLPPDFVGAAVYVNEHGKAYHAGFAIGYQNESFLFHWDVEGSGKIEMEDLSRKDWYVHKDFISIPPVLAPPFLVHCQKIQKLSAPEWGCFFNGTYFKEGEIFNKNAEPYYMTCVGFCLSVLKGFDEETDYLSYDDWTADNSLNDDYISEFLKELKQLNPDINEADLRGNIRRIKPSEYLASAYLDDQPIKKEKIDPLVKNVERVVKDLRFAEVEEK